MPLFHAIKGISKELIGSFWYFPAYTVRSDTINLAVENCTIQTAIIVALVQGKTLSLV